MNFKPSKPLHLFKAGTHTPMGGSPIVFTNDMVKGMAQSYNPAVHKAPLVVGHPKDDAPAHGWFNGELQYKEVGGVGHLYAAADVHNTKFTEAVNKGFFKKLSAAFYTPDSPSNPSPGNYCLRHVGAVPIPAVKGLADIDLSVELAEGNPDLSIVHFSDGDTDAGSVQFADSGGVAFGYGTSWGFDAIANLFRSLRDRMIEKDGLEAANQLFTDYDIANIETAARREREEAIQEAADAANKTTPPFLSTPSFAEGALTMDQQQRLAELEAQNAALLTQIEADKVGKAKAKTAADVSFAEGLVSGGLITPAQKPALLALLAVSADVVSFSEPDGNGAASGAASGATTDVFTGTPHQAIQMLLAGNPASALFAEAAGGAGAKEDPLVKMAVAMGLAHADVKSQA